ncbi:MAG: phosphotransferase [Candidatus Latescibacterota bacterium]|jgi:aminoglycoside phosphotransferase (APT) family kinase protein|tara:strand:- start:322 stop:762 length:441 start_codon:yes stop_codon:yes gene_type:complete
MTEREIPLAGGNVNAGVVRVGDTVRRHEVICHNDFAPYNFYKDQLPYALIDFDLAGPRLRDIAYAAYWMTPLSFHSDDRRPFAETDLQAEGRRLRLFCATYGVPIDGALFDMVAEQLSFMGSERHMQQVLGVEAAAKLKREGHLDH